jgi:transcriptional regulator with XRE-family HTH domain
MSTVNEEVVRRELGRRIAQLRARQGMTQGDLAQRLGVKRAGVAHWERGFHAPSLAQLIELGEALDVRLDKLILGGIPDQLGDPGLPGAKLQRMAQHLNALKEIVRTEQKRRGAAERPASATGQTDADPLANSGKGLKKEAV